MEKLLDQRKNCFWVAAVKPMDIWIGTKPGELAFGIASGVGDQALARSIETPCTLDMPDHVAVTQ